MRKSAWTITGVALLGIASTAHAERAPKEEVLGFGAGAVIGAAAGGPVGFVVGAALGGTLGNHWHAKDEQIETLDAERRNADTSVDALRRESDALAAELDRLERTAHRELVSLLKAGIDLDLLFRTDESALVADTDQRLKELGARLAAMPHVQVHLDGFADERGDAAYNQRLSEERVAYVRDRLVNAGVDPSRISEVAHGEVVASEPGEDNYALERRVSLKVFIDPDRSLAAM
jgi:outer membrane protein OmpA-like peptidoglycan-associated protein